MIELATYFACLIFATLTLFQIALILGAPIGHLAWGGSHKILPVKLRIGSVIAVILYGIFWIFILNKAELINMIPNEGIVNVGMWVITAYFALGILMNAISRSKLERAIMTPVAAVLAALFLTVTLS